MAPTLQQKQKMTDALKALEVLANFVEPNEIKIQEIIDDPDFEGTRIKALLEMPNRSEAFQKVTDDNIDILFGTNDDT